MTQDTMSDAANQNSDAARKRRNRWGDALPDEPTAAAAAAGVADVPVLSTPITLPSPTTAAAADVASSSSSSALVSTGDDASKKPRRSRWAAADPAGGAAVTALNPAVANLGVPPLVTAARPVTEETIQQTIVLNLQLQQINSKIMTVARDALMIELDPNRSASPPPKYDVHGKRTNTREVRMRESLAMQRATVIETLIKLNPHYIPPSDFVKVKPTKKIYMPKNADPNFNYIGLIIGPRGNTQKQMEMETGCKISIRGKGSAKEGSKGRAAKNADDDDDLHVHIQGESMDNVEKAARLIDAILRPVDDTLNEHKQKQLRELALINGTLREDEYCPVCGEKGHRQFDCPYRAKAFKAAGVKCAICGDLSHPTRDCPMKTDEPQSKVALENEYDSFLAELSGKEKPNKPAESQVESNKSGPQELDPMAGSSRVPIQLLSNSMPSMYGIHGMAPVASQPGYPAWPSTVGVSPPLPPLSAQPPPPPSAPAPPNSAYPYSYAGMCYPSDPSTAQYYAQYAAYYAQHGFDPNVQK